MKKIVLILACFIGLTSFAQNIPADSLEFYRRSAHVLLIDNKMDEAVALYKKLALSGDALSGYQLYELYSQGKGVQKDPQEAERWSTLAQQTIAQQQSRDKNQHTSNQPSENQLLTLDDLLNESGSLIEKGALEKNTAIVTGIIGGVGGGVLLTVGTTQQSTFLTVIGGIVAGGCGLAALVLDIVGNKHIKQGGELMRRVRIEGTGISVKF
jgi:hypothetical protein